MFFLFLVSMLIIVVMEKSRGLGWEKKWSRFYILSLMKPNWIYSTIIKSNHKNFIQGLSGQGSARLNIFYHNSFL